MIPVIFNIPHDSTYIPDWVRPQFCLSDEELEAELLKMTDRHTKLLFLSHEVNPRYSYASVSRLVVDVERFIDDSKEVMASRGMGSIYSSTSDKRKLRFPLKPEQQKRLIEEYYLPVHSQLSKLVDEALDWDNHCLVVDCHSFPSKPLPYELDQSQERPDICIGVDDFHTPIELVERVVTECERQGFSCFVNRPFSGALVPLKHFNKDKRVYALMIEVNRRLYMDEENGGRLDSFNLVAKKVNSIYRVASSWNEVGIKRS